MEGREPGRGRGTDAGAVTAQLEQRIADGKAQLEAADTDVRKLRVALERAQERIQAAEAEAARNLELRLRIERARRSEREWARELRDQLSRLHTRQGTLSRGDDVPTMLLHLARTLVEADKALLLARGDADHDGKLDLVAHEGFEHDPAESAVAQRFARAVLERDRIIREDEPAHEGAEAVDEEIENLAALPIFVHDTFHGVVVAANRKGGFEEVDDDVLLSVGDHAGAVFENTRLHGSLRKAYVATVQLFADALEYKDPSASAEHERLSDVVHAVGRRLDLPPSSREALVFAWLLHDVGKLGVSERLLFKPAPLTPEERRTVDLHPQLGAQVVERVPALESLVPTILYHHERFDGTGHPAGLSGDQIPLEARIIAVADAFGAMTAYRPYREAVSDEEALAELARCAGTQFDPAVVSAFTTEIRRRGSSLQPLHREPNPLLESRRDRDEPVLGHGPLGLTDNLTLLYSHRYLHETAEVHTRLAAADGTPFAVVIVEFANLGAINAREGYAAGDRVLVHAARALERLIATDGGIACRYSGRRLALVMPGCGVEELSALVQRIAAGVDADGVEVRVGAASWEPGDEAPDVVARVRQAIRV
jgi:diguanylate cyclase (GGDEF)-like protein